MRTDKLPADITACPSLTNTTTQTSRSTKESNCSTCVWMN
jgi:hypothetical protein